MRSPMTTTSPPPLYFQTRHESAQYQAPGNGHDVMSVRQ